MSVRDGERRVGRLGRRMWKLVCFVPPQCCVSEDWGLKVDLARVVNALLSKQHLERRKPFGNSFPHVSCALMNASVFSLFFFLLWFFLFAFDGVSVKI